MLKIVALYFCLTIFLVSGDGNATSGVVSPVLKPNPAETTVLQSTGVEIPFEPTDKPSPPTVAPNTTVAPITTTTTTTIAPSPKPNTTTTSTTTTTTTTTTPATTTTTPAPLTTTPIPPKPTPAPAPKTGTWVVNGTNETCIVVQMAVQFNVSYEATNNKTLWQELTLPTDNSTVVSGSCGTKEQTLNITWLLRGDLVFHFTKNDTNTKYSLHHIEVTFQTHNFPNIKPNTTMKFVHQADQFPTKLSNSYRCMRLQKLGLMRNATNATTAYLELSDLQFQAFKSDKTTGFGAAEDCSTDVPDVVPIAVGCALTVLVIIVLAAYLIGRRRSQARGYVSM